MACKGCKMATSIRCWQVSDAPKSYQMIFPEAQPDDWVLITDTGYLDAAQLIAIGSLGHSQKTRQLDGETWAILASQVDDRDLTAVPEQGKVSTDRSVRFGG